MNIAIDASFFFERNPSGAGRYATSITTALLALDGENMYTALAFIDDRRKKHLVPNDKLPYTYLPMPRKVYSQWFKQMGPVAVNRWLTTQPDVMLYPNFVNFPRVKNAKSIVVIHDTAFIEQRDTLSKRDFGPIEPVVPKRFVAPNAWYLDRYVPRAIADADAVVAVSEETRDSLAQHFGINASSIIVAPNAVDDHFFTKPTADEQRSVAARLSLPDTYLLFLGTLEPRKNVINLLEAYALLPQVIRDAHPLILAGNPGWNNTEIHTRIKELVSEGNSILPIGFVEDDLLPALYRGAAAFVWPSIHEGFGLPILEAMAAKTPVITSDLAPMNRIGQDAAVFVDPYNPKEIAAAVESVLTHPEKAKSMVERGSRVASGHRWETSAQKLLDCIQKLGSASS